MGIVFDRDILYRLYVTENKTLKEVSEVLGCCVQTVKKNLRWCGIEIKQPGNYKDKEYNLVSPFKQDIKESDIERFLYMYNNYVPIKQISKELGVCSHAVQRKIKELGLSRDTSKMMSHDQYDDSKDFDIIRLYSKGKSSTEIGRIMDMSHRAVLIHLKKNGIKRRSLSESQFKYNNKEFPKDLNDFDKLYDLYVINRLSKKELGSIYNVSPKVIDRCLKKYGITVRGCSESKKGITTGPNHPNWKGGRTALYMRIRTFFRVNQVRIVLKRDNRVCQLCGSKKKLQVHHIVPFKKIFQTILDEHPELDLIDNSEELYQIMTTDERMTDLDNLITYCKECHLYEIHGFKKRETNEE